MWAFSQKLLDVVRFNLIPSEPTYRSRPHSFSEHRVISTGHTQFLWHGGLLRAATWMNCQFAALLARRKPTDTQMMVLLQRFTMGCKNMIGGLRCGACNLVVLFRNLLPGHGDWVLVRRGKWNLNVWN